MDLTVEKLVKMIDHTVLKPETTRAKVKQLCDEAISYDFVAICINSAHVEYAADLLKDTDVQVCVVVGFPLGASLSSVKAFETEECVKRGAHEIDMVMNVGALRDENYELVQKDIETVVVASGNAHVRLMRETVGPKMGVKAAGGIRNFKDAWRVIEAGADRLGTSAGVAIVEDFRWAQYSDSWMAPDKPCWTCPSRMASMAKQPKEVYRWYKERCLTCPDKEHNVFND
jgi:deoxyribose-phosphate aldolase